MSLENCKNTNPISTIQVLIPLGVSCFVFVRVNKFNMFVCTKYGFRNIIFVIVCLCQLRVVSFVVKRFTVHFVIFFFVFIYIPSILNGFFPLEVRCSFHRYCCKTGTYYGYSLGGHICTTSSMYAFTNQPYDPSRTCIPANKQHTRYASPISP